MSIVIYYNFVLRFKINNRVFILILSEIYYNIIYDLIKRKKKNN